MRTFATLAIALFALNAGTKAATAQQANVGLANTPGIQGALTPAVNACQLGIANPRACSSGPRPQQRQSAGRRTGGSGAQPRR